MVSFILIGHITAHLNSGLELKTELWVPFETRKECVETVKKLTRTTGTVAGLSCTEYVITKEIENEKTNLH